MKIIYSNKENFLETLENIKKDWINNLHVLADFDRTLTSAYIKWKKTWSLVSVLRTEEAQLWWECAKEDTKLFEKYFPIEISNKIGLEEKKEKMIEWWMASFNLFIKHNLNKNALKDIAKTDKLQLRKYSELFLNNLVKSDIPLVIISASWIWKLSIQYFLEYRKIFFKNIDIISNDFIWDENGVAKSFKFPIIHSFNKSETVLEKFPEIHNKIENRKNVILLWDSLWDPHMVDWFEYKNLLKIWFLNEKEDELLESYKEKYDVIITWDWDFWIINEIMKEIKS